MIHKASTLPDLLAALPQTLGSVRVQPFAPRAGKPAHLLIIQAKKGGRADFCLEAPICLHQGAAHTENGKDYNPLVECALRSAAPLPMAGPA